MPTYEFKCPKCETRFDVSRPMSKAGNAARCPDCRTKAVRVFGAAIVGVGSDFDLDEGLGGMDDMGMGGMPGMGGHDHDHDLPMDDDFGF